jgi:soluble epoxide hydrolase / lipid-phosphate phosphatase
MQADYQTTTKPVIFVGSSRDEICASKLIHGSMEMFAKGSYTFREFDADHWVIWSHADELNRELLTWIKTIDA